MKYLIIFLCLVGSLYGQYVISPAATDYNGVPTSATVAICTTNPGSGPCTSLVTTYTTSALSVACSGTGGLLSGTGCTNPGDTDGAGNIVAYAQPGLYYCRYSRARSVPYTVPCPATAAPGSGSGSVTNVATGTGLTGGPITTTGTIALATPVAAANGGTHLDTSASTGVPSVASGTWSVSTALPDGTTGTTQTAGDNTTKVATDAFVLANASGTLKVNGSTVSSPNLNGTTPAATTGLNNAEMQVSGSSISIGVFTNFVDLSDGYTSGDPCAYANTVMKAQTVASGNYFMLGGFLQYFTDGIVPCQSNVTETFTGSGMLDLGGIHLVKSVPLVTPGRFGLTGTGTADVGTTAAAVNSVIQDCGPEAPGWNGTACSIHGITVAAFPSTGHCTTFTYPHSMMGAGTYCSSVWLGGMGASATTNGGSFGDTIQNLTIWSGAGGGDFGLYITGAQEQSYCRNVTIRASNSVGIFLDRVQGTSSGPSHLDLYKCASRMDDAQTAALGYPNVSNQVGMGYDIVYDGNADVIWFDGGTGGTVFPQAVPTVSGGHITTATVTNAGAGWTVAPTCHVSTNRAGTGATCSVNGLSGGAITGITMAGTQSGYSAGDISAGGFQVRSTTLNGDTTKDMQSAIVLDGCANCILDNIHPGWDAGYNIVMGFNGPIIGGKFTNIDFEGDTAGIIHLGTGIDKGQQFSNIGKGGAVNAIVDDLCYPTGFGQTVSTVRYVPCTDLELTGSGPAYPSGFSVTNGGGGSTTLAVSAAGAITATEPTGSVWGSATGGAKGAGTINAEGLYVNGTAVGAGSGTINNAAQESEPYYSAAGSTNTISGLAPPTTNGVWESLWNVTGSAAVQKTITLPGIPVDSTNPATLLYSDRGNLLNWTSGTALALPAVPACDSTHNLGCNLPFVLWNKAGSTLTITPNAAASDLINGASSLAVLNNWSVFTYQDSTTAPGGWWALRFPNFGAFGSTCTNGLTWSTSTGFGCLSAAPIKSGDSAGGSLTGTYPNPTLASSLTLTTPNIGAATGTSLLATGIVDGVAPTTITTSGCVTGTHCALGATYKSGYTWNNFGTAATTSFYDLPSVANTVAGMQYCVTNGYGAGGAVTGAISVTPLTTAAIAIKGALGTANHAAVSGGAAGDSACFVAVDTTHWIAYVQSGTWTTP